MHSATVKDLCTSVFVRHSLCVGGSIRAGGIHIYSYEPDSKQWISASDLESAFWTSPAPRCDAGFASAGGKLYLYGGTAEHFASELYSEELFVYDPVNASWTDLTSFSSGTPPLARSLHGFTSDGFMLYVHGGESEQSHANFIAIEKRKQLFDEICIPSGFIIEYISLFPSIFCTVDSFIQLFFLA
jgi:hypothetical protein